MEVGLKLLLLEQYKNDETLEFSSFLSTVLIVTRPYWYPTTVIGGAHAPQIGVIDYSAPCK